MGNINREDLFREIGEIDEAYVEEAERFRRKRKTALWMRTGAVAASLLFCAGLGYGALRLTNVSNDTANMSGGAMEEAAQTYSMAEEDVGQNDRAGQENCAAGSGEAQDEDIFQENGAEAEEPRAIPEKETAQDSVSTSGGIGQESATTDGIAQTPEENEDTASDKEQDLAESCLLKEEAETLTWEAAREDAVYGRYVDVQIPEGYEFTSGSRTASGLHLIWSKGTEEITVSCRQADESVSDWLVDADSPREYDLGLYTIPLAQSVPQELIQKVSNATFYADQVSLQIVEARSYQMEEQGDEALWRTQIGILYSGNVLVDIRSKGPSPEEIYALINLEN